MLDIVIVVAILFMAIILHEYAHGWMAFQRGDPTAKLAGRLTLNPIKHIDPIGTILLPGILIGLRMMGHNVFVFGWAKPVPVNFGQLRKPKQDMILVALAGPIINIIIAVLFSQLLLVIPLKYFHFVVLGIFINLLLAIFNMIPIPPLDGSRVVMGLLPNRLAYQYARLERYGILIVVALLYLGLFERVVLPVIIACGHLLGVELS